MQGVSGLSDTLKKSVEDKTGSQNFILYRLRPVKQQVHIDIPCRVNVLFWGRTSPEFPSWWVQRVSPTLQRMNPRPVQESASILPTVGELHHPVAAQWKVSG